MQWNASIYFNTSDSLKQGYIALGVCFSISYFILKLSLFQSSVFRDKQWIVLLVKSKTM